MIRLALILSAAAALGGCATHCEVDTPGFAQPADRYGGIATAQGGCAHAARPVSRAQVQEYAS